MAKTFPKQIDKSFDDSFSTIFLVYRWELKNTTKKRFAKNRVEKFLQNNRQKSKTDCFGRFF
jgi:hypothetical protein